MSQPRFVSIMKTMNAFRRTFALFLAGCLLASNWASVNAQASGSEFFDATGHNVQGEFLQFYHKAANPTLIYGYPITEEFMRTDGLKVQYFQRARFEYNPSLPEGQRVELTSIGRELYVPMLQLNFSSLFACRNFEASGFPVCFTFLEFFDANGGLAQFGNPVSPFEYQDNMIVQYFEKARMEWQPWREDGQRVVIADLGRIYFDKMGEDPGLLLPSPPISEGIAPLVLSLQVRAFVQKAVTLTSDLQTIYIIVQDQSTQFVANADCATSVRWPDGHTESTSSRTDQNGVAVVAMQFSNQPQGQVIYADIACTYNGNVGTTSTSFRIWY